MGCRAGCTGGCGGTCSGTCSSCTGTCAGTCTGDCTGGCSGCGGNCTGSCSGTCAGGCTGCGGNCTGSCSGTCTGGCTGCGGNCTGSCSGTCSGGCTSCSGTCTGGCTGCTACTGTCSGTCNNACTSGSAATTIANFGANILANGKILATDFTTLLSTIVGEYSRRTAAQSAGTYNGTWTATPTYSAYTTTPAIGGKLMLEHMSKYFTDIVNWPSSGKTYTVAQFDIVKTANISDSITYVKTLMNQNIVK